MDILNIAVVGAGYWGKNNEEAHLPPEKAVWKKAYDDFKKANQHRFDKLTIKEIM